MRICVPITKYALCPSVIINLVQGNTKKTSATFTRHSKIKQRRRWRPIVVCFVMMLPVPRAVLPASIFPSSSSRYRVIMLKVPPTPYLCRISWEPVAVKFARLKNYAKAPVYITCWKKNLFLLHDCNAILPKKQWRITGSCSSVSRPPVRKSPSLVLGPRD
jgi:hypothetical protein